MASFTPTSRRTFSASIVASVSFIRAFSTISSFSRPGSRRVSASTLMTSATSSRGRDSAGGTLTAAVSGPAPPRADPRRRDVGGAGQRPALLRPARRLAAGLAQPPAADGLHEPGLFGRRQEVPRQGGAGGGGA